MATWLDYGRLPVDSFSTPGHEYGCRSTAAPSLHSAVFLPVLFLTQVVRGRAN